MNFIDESNNKKHEYPTYGRAFCTYKWYKPLITALVCGIIYAVLLMALTVICAPGTRGITSVSYENLDFNNLVFSIFVLGSLAVVIPALWLASKIVKDRPFSSYSSARGGWNFKTFFICLAISFVLCTLPLLVRIYKATGFEFDVEMSLMGFLIILILGPLQCIAEEYIYRGLFMQTLGSWIGKPVLVVIIQAIVFSLSHIYNVYGLIAILLSGLCLGFSSYITRGIEASSAFHIANNVPVFFLIGLHLGHVSSDPTIVTAIRDIVPYALFVLIMLILKKKTRLFDEMKKDDLEAWNNKYTK